MSPESLRVGRQLDTVALRCCGKHFLPCRLLNDPALIRAALAQNPSLSSGCKTGAIPPTKHDASKLENAELWLRMPELPLWGAHSFGVLVSDRLPGVSDHRRIVSAQRESVSGRGFASFRGEVGLGSFRPILAGLGLKLTMA